jgi:hypothetical protein
VKVESRANVASSFTVIKGSMINETYAVMAAWDFRRSKRENLDHLRETNFIGATSIAWLRDVCWVLNRRFEPDGVDRPLVTLAQKQFPIEEWKPLLLWHMTRSEFLVRDFLENWLFNEFEAGSYQLRTEGAKTYLSGIAARGAVTEHAWTDRTTRSVAAGLLKIGVDFGLLKGTVNREFVSFHLPERSLLYLLHVMQDMKISPGKLTALPVWRLFLMRPSDVEHELLRLHQFRKLDYQVAGSIVQLSLPCASASEYVERVIA